MVQGLNQNNLVDLLYDQSGVIFAKVENIETVTVRLRQLIHNWPDDDIDKKNALYLAEGMELAHQQNEPLGFI